MPFHEIPLMVCAAVTARPAGGRFRGQSRSRHHEPVAESPVPPSGPATSGSPASCLLCGVVAPAPGAGTLTWALDRDEHGRERWFCPGCVRRHVRDIEAKLAHEWW